MAAQIDGQHLTEQQLLGFCVLLLVAGNETTTHLIANAIWCLDEYPEAMEELRANRALLPGAVEEALRHRSPIKMMFRVTVQDTTIEDTKIQAGEAVVAWIGSANRDEAQFPNADTFNIHRAPNRHLAFGHSASTSAGRAPGPPGIEDCTHILLDCLPNLRRDRNITLEPISAFILHGCSTCRLHLNLQGNMLTLE